METHQTIELEPSARWTTKVLQPNPYPENEPGGSESGWLAHRPAPSPPRPVPPTSFNQMLPSTSPYKEYGRTQPAALEIYSDIEAIRPSQAPRQDSKPDNPTERDGISLAPDRVLWRRQFDSYLRSQERPLFRPRKSGKRPIISLPDNAVHVTHVGHDPYTNEYTVGKSPRGTGGGCLR